MDFSLSEFVTLLPNGLRISRAALIVRDVIVADSGRKIASISLAAGGVGWMGGLGHPWEMSTHATCFVNQPKSWQ